MEKTEKRRRSPDLVGSVLGIYMLVSAGAALGIVLGNISSGITVLSMPSWAWVFWAVSLLVAGSISIFGRRRRSLRPVLATGIYPMIVMFLMGAMLDPQGMDRPIELLQQTPRELFQPFGWVALLIAPSFALVIAGIGWAEDRGLIARDPE